jgi:serine/threonine protein kinase
MAATAPSIAEPQIMHMDALPAGTHLSEFELQGLLGVGGFGMVYRAYDHSLQRQVAIKEYMPSALAGRAGDMSVSMRSSVDNQTFVAGLKSFMAEARLLAQFDHPSLVKVFRVWEANNTAYMVMPFYNGMTLKQARAQMRSPPPEAWLRKVLWSILEGLKVLHAHNTVHRDVSPDNIFLQDVGPPVLLDLGAARRAIGDKTQRHTAILKVNYAPIEQYADAEDMRQGPWTDIYSLAAVVHGCLCNDPPVPATFRVLRDRMPTMASVAQTVHEQFGIDYSQAFVQGITDGLQIRPAERPQSVVAFESMLGLEPPAAMARFDWRAELGDIWVPPGSVGAPAAEPLPSTAPEDRTQWTGPPPVPTEPAALAAVPTTAPAPLTAPAPEAPAPQARIDLPTDVTIRVPPAQAQAARPARPSSAAAAKRRSNMVMWGLVGVAAALLAAFATVVSREPTTVANPQAPASQPAQAAASAPAPAAPAEAKAPEVTTVPAPVAAAPASAAAPMAAASAPAPMRGASAEAEARAPVAKASAPVRVPNPAAKAPATAASSAAAAAVAAAASAPQAQQPPRPPVVVRPEPRPEAVAPPPRQEAPRPQALTAAEICPDSNFLSRPMCLFRECQKPAFASMPVCVENNRRLQGNNPAGP